VVQPRYRTARANTLLEAGEDIGYPVVLKAADVEHKSDVGAIALDIRDGEALLRAAESMGPSFDHFYVESMIRGGVAELLVGVVQDEQFGQSLTLGAGGMLVELFGDRCTLLYPLTREAVIAALDRLAVAKLLDGYRGRPRGDRRAAIEAIMAIATPTSRIQELEVNPLMVLPEGEGAVAVDVLIRVRGQTRWD
jgi:acetyl-CoA synthetase